MSKPNRIINFPSRAGRLIPAMMYTMPAKILCPISPDELAALYDKMTSYQLADYINNNFPLSVSANWVIRRLKEFGIPIRKHSVSSPYRQERIKCPFSRDRLFDLYWREGKSLQEIAVIASELLNRSICYGTVKNWLTRYNIKTRTPHEWLTLRARKDPERYAEHARKYMQGKHHCPGKGNTNLTRRDIAKGVKAAALKKKLESRETRTCAYPPCEKPVTRRKSEFRHPPERTYCCRAHANKHRYLLKLWSEDQEWLEQEKQIRGIID